jgi:hypothetical protein
MTHTVAVPEAASSRNGYVHQLHIQSGAQKTLDIL